MNDTIQPAAIVRARKPYRTAQIKPSTRDALKDVLAQAADALFERTVERDSWRCLAERDEWHEPEAGTPFPALALLAIGFVIGALAGWLL